ncbi:MAG: cytochrome P460 family protein [Planctomycetota bacterium]
MPKKTTVASLLALSISACTLFQGEPDPRWSDYRSWTSVAKGLTGDDTGSLGGVHRGEEGFRNVWVNDTGKQMLLSDGPYIYPVGTVIVKEQFGSKSAWERDTSPDLTVMVKVQEGEGEDTWHYAVGWNGAGPDRFCSDCHEAVEEDDFVFTNGYFLGGE